MERISPAGSEEEKRGPVQGRRRHVAGGRRAEEHCPQQTLIRRPRDVGQHMRKKVKTDAQRKLVSSVRSLGKKIAYDRKKQNKYPPSWVGPGGGGRPLDRLGLWLIASEILRVWVSPPLPVSSGRNTAICLDY